VGWATALALTGSAWLVWLAGQPSTGAAVRSGPHGIAAWMMTSLLALPVVIGGVWVSTQLSRLVRGAIAATPLTVALHALLVSSAASTGLGTGWHLQTAFAGADPPVRTLFLAEVLILPATLVVTLCFSAVAGLTDRSPRPRASSSRRLVGSRADAVFAPSATLSPGRAVSAKTGTGPHPAGTPLTYLNVGCLDLRGMS